MSNSDENFWLNDLTVLFKQLNFIPYGDVASGSRLNAITRLIIVAYIIMLICKYKYANAFLIIGIIFVITVFMCFKENAVKGLRISTSLREPFILEEEPQTTLQYYNKQYEQYAKKGYNILHRDYKNFHGDRPFQNTIEPQKMLPATHRDVEADIQYYTPDVGVNDRMFIEPLIAPRSHDRDVWSMPSTYPSGMNTDTLYDVTQANNFPNNINNYKYGEYGIDKYTRDETPIFSGVGNWESDQNIENPMITLQNINKNKKEEEKKNIATKYAEPPQQNKMSQNPYNPMNSMNSVPYQSSSSSNLRNYQYLPEGNVMQEQIGGKTNITSIENVLSKDPRTGNYMIEPTPTYIYTDDYFNQPQRRLFLQEIQPNHYSYSVEQTPINSNIGISYTEQIPPKFRDQVYTKNNNYPVLTRVDPQLVRDDGLTPGQRDEQPQRNGISAKYSNWNPPAGSINFEDIYDPRFSSYGDPYRGYSDVNLGQVQYYYSDIDAYKQPNFIIRSNVDFVDYHDPNGKIKPYYERTATLEDVKDIVENRYDADDLYHREDIMASKMAKRNSEMYQLRAAPLRQQNNSRSYTHGPY